MFSGVWGIRSPAAHSRDGDDRRQASGRGGSAIVVGGAQADAGDETPTEEQPSPATSSAPTLQAGVLSVWTAASTGEFTQLLTASDSAYQAGYLGVAGGGNFTRAANFRGAQLPPF
jgi:hypothetical protein